MANVLLNEAFNNQAYRFTASIAYSLSGKEIKYTPVEVPEYKEQIKK